MKRFRTVDEFLRAERQWPNELNRLCEILRATRLEETVKWGGPVYTYQGKNVVGVGGFKSYFGLWFYQGVSLSDPARILVNAQPDRTKALRQWRMKSLKDIQSGKIKTYVREAISIVESGREIKLERFKPLVIPAELEKKLVNHRSAKAAFDKFTKGKQREFADFISAAKRPETKQSRLDKILPMILNGSGLNDKYRH